jgi:hypothetical protein
MIATGPFNELEYLILAMVGDGISSGYAMRKEMNRMRGGRWSSESGSVYRVLRRLEDAGLAEEACRAGVKNRERTEYRLTAQGEAVVTAWLTFSPERTELGFLVDPIRTRAYFLTRLKPAERIRVVKSWLAESKKFCEELERDLDETAFGIPIRDMAYHNLLYLSEARHAWLKKLLVTVRSESRSEEKAAKAAS